jgi:hypothetical protein
MEIHKTVHPGLLGIVNAIIPGLGYIILKQRLVFGWCMLATFVLFLIVTLTDPSPAFDTVLFAVSPTGQFLEVLAYILALFAFGYDVYDMARTKKSLNSSF